MLYGKLGINLSAHEALRFTQMQPNPAEMELNFNSIFCRQGIIGMGFFRSDSK